MEKHDIHYAWPSPELASSVSVLQTGRFSISPPYALDRMNGWVAYNLIHTTAGSVEAAFNDETYTAGPGSVLVLPKTVPHRLTLRQGRWEGYWIEYDGRWVDAIHTLCGFDAAACIPDCGGSLPAFRDLFESLDDGSSTDAMETVPYLWRILAESGIAYRSVKTMQERAVRAADAAKAFVRTNLAHAITAKDMARAAGMSVFHFSRLFRQAAGYSPAVYLRKARINRACVLLRNTRLNVSEVGQAVGYPVVQHFSVVFKKTVGVTPRGYRSS